jgi:hypothetical protein
MYNNGKYGKGGYTPFGNETVALSMISNDETQSQSVKPDPVESFEYLEKNLDPSHHNPIPAAKEYHLKMTNLLKVIHSLSCAALQIEDLNYFDQFYDPLLPGNEDKGGNMLKLRLSHYIPHEIIIPIQNSTESEIDSKEQEPGKFVWCCLICSSSCQKTVCCG